MQELQNLEKQSVGKVLKTERSFALAAIVAFAMMATSCASVSGASREVAVSQIPEDLSRSEIMAIAAGDQKARALPRRFQFPFDKIGDRSFGIDVSHHNGEVRWREVARQGVEFAYLKASQGETFVDPRFQNNWRALGDLGSERMRRGAYHFFSASSEPANQARNFLTQISNRSERDLPPTLDLEWDFQRDSDGKLVKDAQGRPIDKWASISPDEIVRRAQVWLAAVEAETGQKPIIYTNGYWWRDRIGAAGIALNRHLLWIADYRDASLGAEEPNGIPEGFSGIYWQFTDRGWVSGICGLVDVNIENASSAQ